MEERGTFWEGLCLVGVWFFFYYFYVHINFDFEGLRCMETIYL